MKKLLILMLVLGLASTASATYTIRVAHGTSPGVAPDWETDYYDPVDTELVLEPSDLLWIGAYNDTLGVPGATQQVDNLFLAIAEPSPDTAWTGNWVMYSPPMVPGAPDNVYDGVQDFWGTGALIDLWVLFPNNGVPDSFMGIGVIDAKELHCVEGPSDDLVYLIDQTGTIIDTILIHQVPEPMTVMLLGLGGLLLRRRK